MAKNTITKGYYAVFKCSSDAVDVYFPDLPGCQTCARDMEEAFEYAVDALAAWLETAEGQFIPEKPMTFEEVQKRYPDQIVMKIPVEKSISQ
jgi:antitoxin HicB